MYLRYPDRKSSGLRQANVRTYSQDDAFLHKKSRCLGTFICFKPELMHLSVVAFSSMAPKDEGKIANGMKEKSKRQIM